MLEKTAVIRTSNTFCLVFAVFLKKYSSASSAKLYKINSGANINPGEVLLIKSVTFTETVYTMPVEKFMELATVEGENGEEMEN